MNVENHINAMKYFINWYFAKIFVNNRVKNIWKQSIKMIYLHI